MSAQKILDSQRKTYRIESFPLELSEDSAAAWLRSIKGTLRPTLFRMVTPTIVPEIWSEDNELTFRLRLPWRHHEYIADELQSHIPGLRLVEEEQPPEHHWNYAMEVGLAHGSRPLDIESIERMARTIRSPLYHRLQDGERIILQWVAAPAFPRELPEHNKSQAEDVTLKRLLLDDDLLASRDEVAERRRKLEEPNMGAVLRIGAQAATRERAEHLADAVRQAIASARGTKAYFKKRPWLTQDMLQRRIKEAVTPLRPSVQLSLSEFLALMAWPIGKEHEPAVATSIARHLPPSSLIPREGRGLGVSAMRSKRPIAMSYGTVRHTYLLGATNVGKTTLMENMAVDDMNEGCGVFVIEADGNLFERVLDRVPPKRAQDVIIVDLGDAVRPVGFNVFDQTNSRTAIDELSMLIDRMYRDSSRSITSPRMLYNFAHALAEVPDSTFIDLATLITPVPKDTPKGIWRDHIAREVKDPEVSAYLQAFLNLSPQKQDDMASPLYNRTWEFMRPEIRMMLGQRTSSFKMRDVVEQNKILLVNLGSCASPLAASLIGTFLVNAIRQAVNAVLPAKPNFLYLDEFETFMGFYTDMDAILDRARKRNLGLVLAHQRLSQLPPPMVDGVMTNTATKVIFRTSAKNAAIVAREFSGLVTEADFTGLPDHEAIALVGIDGGSAPPVSVATRARGDSTRLAEHIRGLSQLHYGRPIQEVERDLASGYVPERTGRKSPRISGSGWGLS